MRHVASLQISFWSFLVACCFLQGTRAFSCPPGWTLYQNHCYSLMKTPRTWNDAEADCQTHGTHSHLASVLSVEENKHLASVIAGGNDPGFRIWIGMFRKKQGGRLVQLRWTDNSNVDYANWAIGQPDRSGYCVEIFGDAYELWNDTDCDAENYYMCKMPLS